MAVRLAEEWFTICGGCEVTILDIGEPLLDVLQQVQIVHMPVLMDHKIYGQTGEKAEMEIPEAEVGMISGGVRNDEHKKLAQEMRKKCKTLIALGSCACYGGVPALANQYTTEEILEKVYRGSVSTDKDGIPNDDIPAMTDRVYAISEVVKVDLQLPGCPTTPEMVAGALTSLLTGSPFALSGKSVCDECPTKREKKAVGTLKRRFEQPEFTPGAPLSEMRCHMEQGFLCLGPATRAGCAGQKGGPRCVMSYMPCRGCFGPVSHACDSGAKFLSAIASLLQAENDDQVERVVDTVVDPAGYFYRFTQAASILHKFAALEKAGVTKGYTFTMFEEIWNYGFPQEMQHFINCVLGNETCVETGEDGREVLKIMYAAYQSAGEGRKIEFPYDPPKVGKPIDLWKKV